MRGRKPLFEYCGTCVHFKFAVCICIAVSIVMQGKQMVPVLNSMGINAAVYGNHDFGESSLTLIN